MVSQFENYAKQFRWRFAKTMPQIPHEYIVIENHKTKIAIIKSMLAEINEYGYYAIFGDKVYQYLNAGEYKYWVVENIINRAKNEILQKN